MDTLIPDAWKVGKEICTKLGQAEVHSRFKHLPIQPLYTRETIMQFLQNWKELNDTP